MTHPDSDPRVIAPRAREYNATLVKRVDYTSELASFWIRPDEPVPFRAGQYVTAGIVADQRLWQRPYSVASPPRVVATEGYELYVRHIPVVRFTTLLWRLQPGARVQVSRPEGEFTLEPFDHRPRLYVATGTGIAPLMSLLWERLMTGRPVETVLLHGVSHVSDLGYREVLEGLEQNGTYPLRYVPTISRPEDPRNHGWRGRIGRVEDVLDAVCTAHGIEGDRMVAYVCGNPDMIDTVTMKLGARGIPPQSIHRELYWPKGPERPEWMRRSPLKDMTGSG